MGAKQPISNSSGTRSLRGSYPQGGGTQWGGMGAPQSNVTSSGENPWVGGPIDTGTAGQLQNVQRDFIRGLHGNGQPPAAPQFSQHYQPALDQSLQGQSIDVAGLGAAAESASMRQWRDMQNAIEQSMAATGGMGSSTHVGRMARAGGDLSAKLGEQLAGFQATADENAMSRRMQALDASQRQYGLEDQGMQWRHQADRQDAYRQAQAGQAFLNSLAAQAPRASGSVAGGGDNGRAAWEAQRARNRAAGDRSLYQGGFHADPSIKATQDYIHSGAQQAIASMGQGYQYGMPGNYATPFQAYQQMSGG